MGNEVSLASNKNPLNDSRSRTERLNRVLSFKADTTKALKLSVYSFVDSQKEFSGLLSGYERDQDDGVVDAQSGYSQTSSEIKNFVARRGSGSNYKESSVIEEEKIFSIQDIHHLLSQINTISPNDLELCLDNISINHPLYRGQLYNILNSISHEYKLELGKPLLSTLPNNINSDEHLDWNSKFQSLIEMLQRSDSNSEERLAIYEDLSKLAQDFHETALTYGKLIISEVYVPLENKTIKPQAYLGGIVGGEKFLFATAESKEGLFSTNEAAAKVAGHDLKGLIQYFNLAVDLLHFPMMVLVDYLGFRLQALSWLPIDPNTIIYGSSDAGRTVHAENIKFTKRMKLTAEKLNVKAHEVGLTSKTSKLLYSCADLEGHLGKDGRFYLLDFSRTFPPFDNCQVTSDTSQSNPHLYRIFRPEFIKHYPIPLCSDTFSGFVANHNPKEHIQEIKEATQYLIYDLIPDYARYLNSQNNYSEMLTIKQSLHKRGINMYFMGILRGHISDIKVKKYLLIEMIARSVKHEINCRLRAKLKELRIALQRPLICHIVDYLNLVFGQSKESTIYWNTILKDKIVLNYPHALSKSELDISFDLKSHLDSFDDICLLLKTLSRFNLFKWSSLAEKEFTTNRHAFTYNKPIDETDIEDLCVHTKHIGLVSTSMGLYLKDKALMKTGANSTRLYEAAIEKFEEALLCSADKITMREIAHVYELLNMSTIAEKYYKDAIDVDTKDGINYFRYALFLDRSNRIEDADQYYLKSLELRPDDVIILKCYGEFLYRHNHKEEASKFFSLAKTYSKASSIKTDIIYENERRTVFGQAFSKSNLLITDTRSAWSNNKDVPMRLNEVDLPSNDWQWLDDWNVDCSSSTISVDSEGWSYALHFNSSEWYPKPSPLTYVRRRRWKRTRKCKDLPKDSDNIQATFSELYTIPKMSQSIENIDVFNIIVKQGFLEKQGAFIQNWKKRFFVLQKGSLSYYAKEVVVNLMHFITSNKDDLSPKGIISLVKCSCCSFQEAKREQLNFPFSFVGYSEADLENSALIVKTINRNYLILCNSAREKEDWITAIKSCIL